MTPLAPTDALLAVAQRVVWFKTPEDALADPRHFLAHVMTYGTIADLAVVKAVVSTEAFREVIDHPPPGIFDARSWAYWNLVIAGRDDPPPLPERFA